jgi:hypothetical protein
MIVYKIIIPKEEPKQVWSKSTGDIVSDYAIGQSKAIQKCMQLDAEMAYKSLPKQVWFHNGEIIDIKQETLEEVAERLYPVVIKPILDVYDDGVSNQIGEENINEDSRESFINGAKWQQEQIGKSEFLQKLRATLSDAEARRLIFETFKTK